MITVTFTPYDSYVAPNGRVCRGKSRNYSGSVETRLIFEDLPKYDLIFLRNRHLVSPTHFLSPLRLYFFKYSKCTIIYISVCKSKALV